MIEDRIVSWKLELEGLTRDYNASFGNLDSTALNTKPNANTWSIAQVIDHVIKTNESYYPVMKQVREGKYQVPALGKISFIHNFFGNLILKAVEPLRKKKVKTFPIWEPSTSNIEEGILQRFQQHQIELANLIENSKDLMEKGTLISSPANKNIVYKLDKTFDILVSHERRHYNQAMEILEQIR